MEIDDKEYEKLQNDLKAATEAAGAVTSLQESVAKLEENNKNLLQEKSDAKKAAQVAAEEAAKKSGDVEALEKSWQEKLEAEKSSRDSKLSVYEQQISDMTAGSAARAMASELALPGSADVLLPHIKNRLSVDMTGDSPLVRVLDKDGKPSALSIDDLKKEIEADKSFAPLLVGSRASGSGEVGKKGGNMTDKTVTRAEFDSMSQADRSKFSIDGGKVVDVH